VYLVGGGPGDPDLFTLRGHQLLQKCDIVIYDKLSPLEHVISLPPHIERRYVGKQAGDHSLPQDQINQLLVDQARAGKTVVRLKGGDPLTFGRGGEEASFLRQHGIPFEIVPGVTAGSGTLAYAGIPNTDRRCASGVLFVTGHAGTHVDSSVDWEWVARAKHTTVVIYMGVKELPNIVEKLKAGGMPPDTPAAIIERGTRSDQRVLKSTLASLPNDSEENNVRPPALFVLGDVVSLTDELQWYRKKPLADKRVLITRPADQADEIYSRLRELGAGVIALPTIATRAHLDPDGWKAVPKGEERQPWLVVTSENGVRYFAQQFVEHFGDVRKLAPFRIAAVGFGTARALEQYQLKAEFVPTKATTSSLAAELTDYANLQGVPVVRVRGNLGDDAVENLLEAAGARVVPLQVYETYKPTWPPEMKRDVLASPPDIIMFTSGSSSEGFVANVSKDELSRFQNCTIVSIGPMTSKVIRSQGLPVTVEATTHSVPGAIDALLEYVSQGEKE
jgi:uroporphyrinogen III methyltransferase/synthase